MYINLPWISKIEWHAFSLYKHPTLHNHSSVCVAKVGDWSKELHSKVSMQACRLGWVYGPFPSIFSTSSGYDNLLCISSRIGIIPALHNVSAYRDDMRTANVIWMCRSASLVEYFLLRLKFDENVFTLTFYSGKRGLAIDEGILAANRNVLLFKGRPNLRKVTFGVINTIDKGSILNISSELTPLPKSLRESSDLFHREILEREWHENMQLFFQIITSTYTIDEL